MIVDGDANDPPPLLERDLGQVMIVGLEGAGQRDLIDHISALPGSECSEDNVRFKHSYCGVDYSCQCPLLEVAPDLEPSALGALLEQTADKQAFILVVDASDKLCMEASRELLRAVEGLLEPPPPPLLVIAANMDSPDACSISEFFGIMELTSILR